LLGCICNGSGNTHPTATKKYPAETEELPAETEEPAEEPVGSITKDRSLVKAGPDNAMKTVSDSRDLYNDDSVNVTDGGKAFLTFPGGIEFILFNETEIDGVNVEISGSTPPRVAWKLQRGGLSGEVVEEGSELEINVVSGTTITVVGTEFFVVFDEETGYLTIGKIEGELFFQVPGADPIWLGDEELVDITPEGSTQYYPILFDLDTFNQAADASSTPLEGLNNLRLDTGIPLPIETEIPSGEKPISIIERGLVRNDQGKIFPDLAEDWYVEDYEEEKTWTFILNSSFRLENGEPFTAYSAMEVFDEWDLYTEGWLSIVVVDEYTLEFYLTEESDQALAERGYPDGLLWALADVVFPIQVGY